MRIQDNPKIFIRDDNLERAIKLLKSRFGAYGTRTILKMRALNPGRSAWKRAKRKKSLKRYMRAKEKGRI